MGRNKNRTGNKAFKQPKPEDQEAQEDSADHKARGPDEPTGPTGVYEAWCWHAGLTWANVRDWTMQREWEDWNDRKDRQLSADTKPSAAREPPSLPETERMLLRKDNVWYGGENCADSRVLADGFIAWRSYSKQGCRSVALQRMLDGVPDPPREYVWMVSPIADVQRFLLGRNDGRIGIVNETALKDIGTGDRPFALCFGNEEDDDMDQARAYMLDVVCKLIGCRGTVKIKIRGRDGLVSVPDAWSEYMDQPACKYLSRHVHKFRVSVEWASCRIDALGRSSIVWKETDTMDRIEGFTQRDPHHVLFSTARVLTVGSEGLSFWKDPTAKKAAHWFVVFPANGRYGYEPAIVYSFDAVMRCPDALSRVLDGPGHGRGTAGVALVSTFPDADMPRNARALRGLAQVLGPDLQRRLACNNKPDCITLAEWLGGIE